MFLNSPVTEQAATSVSSYSESVHVVKNVATTRKLSYLIRCYSVHISSQPCLANIERAKDVSKAHVPPACTRAVFGSSISACTRAVIALHAFVFQLPFSQLLHQ